LLAENRRTDPVDVNGELDLRDRCSFQHSFNQVHVPCPAFQSLPFMAATSYGKPLGMHVACAHLQVGESARNQFYPRCALGHERDRERWVATVGPGEIEVARVLMAEFESMASPYGARLLEAKAKVIAEAPQPTISSRRALAGLVSQFLAEVDAFITLHATAIVGTGMAIDSLSGAIERAFEAWQGSALLDLPSTEDNWFGTAEHEVGIDAATTVAVPGLLIATIAQPSEVRLTGQIDESNLAAVTASLDAAVTAGAPVTVELSGVTFCSLGGLRHLAIGAACGNLRLAGVPTHLSRALAAADLAAEGVA
jgi:hypothetical protein